MKAYNVMPHAYKPLAIDARMSDYGYWVVTISVAPGLRMDVMICRVGISRDAAIALAGTTVAEHQELEVKP
jgi:hypothetical protein